MKKILSILSILLLTFLLSGCHLVEVNMVQRATLEEGSGITSSQQDTTLDREENSMELVVPLK